MTKNEIEKRVQAIIRAYKHLVLRIDKRAQEDTSARAYGGILRSSKGKLVEEDIAKQIVLIAWESLGQDLRRLSFPTKQIKIPIRREYIKKIKDSEIQEYLSKNINKCYYGQKSDLHVYVDNKFVIAVECKAYSENAMMKRILVDFTLLKVVYPHLDCVLFQLESQLGGDYSVVQDKSFGSFPTHTLMSFFDLDLHIITLLQGERRVDRPIHKSKFYKALTKKSLYRAIQTFHRLLEKYK